MPTLKMLTASILFVTACATSGESTSTDVADIQLGDHGASLLDDRGHEIGQVRYTIGERAADVTTTLAGHTFQTTWLGDSYTVSCRRDDGTTVSGEACDAAHAVDGQIGQLAGFDIEPEVQALAGCRVKLDRCYPGGYGCTATSCTRERAESACDDLGELCRAWGY